MKNHMWLAFHVGERHDFPLNSAFSNKISYSHLKKYFKEISSASFYADVYDSLLSWKWSDEVLSPSPSKPRDEIRNVEIFEPWKLSLWTLK